MLAHFQPAAVVAPSLLQLPQELQARILHFCNLFDLFSLCLCNKELYRKPQPLLWEHIDFAALDIGGGDEEAGQQRRFFAKCASIRRDQPERWKILSALPKLLRFPRLPGPRVSPQPKEGLPYGTDYETWVSFDQDSDIGIYDIIADFVNLETLTLFVKEVCEGEASRELVVRNLSKLEKLEIGGQVSVEMLHALLSRPEQIKTLSLINLVETAGPNWAPDGVLFLDPIQDKFRSLTHLHLSKLAPLHDDFQEVVQLPWEFDFDQDTQVLCEWAGLLRNVSATLEELTLENCYHVFKWPRGHGQVNPRRVLDPECEDGEDDPKASSYGVTASDRCRDILAPVLDGSEWPLLRRLVLKGMYTLSISEAAIPADKITYLPGSVAYFSQEATPLNLSPPASLFRGE